MVTTPPVTPDTTPVAEPIEATAELLLVHVPPLTAFDKVIV